MGVFRHPVPAFISSVCLVKHGEMPTVFLFQCERLPSMKRELESHRDWWHPWLLSGVEVLASLTIFGCVLRRAAGT